MEKNSEPGKTKPSDSGKPPPLTSNHPVEQRFGTLSRYHYYIFTYLYVSKIPVFWHFVSLIFLSPPMTYTCGDKGKNSCPCDDPVWDTSVFSATIQTKFKLICERKNFLAMCHSLLYFGSLVGSFTFGFLADKFGRLKMFSVCVAILGLFGALVSFMPNLPTFMLMRFLEGFGIGGAIVTGYVLCVEYCGIRQRELVTALYHVPLNVGHMTIPLISYALRNFAHFQLAISLPIFLFMFMYCCCLESPKWLLDSGRIDEATKAMEKIAKFNKTSYGNIKPEMEAYHAAHIGNQKSRAKFIDIFKYRQLIINFCCMAVNYFACGMGFYGVSQYIGKMSGNIHLNVTISGAMLIPATCSCVFFLYYLSRKTFLMITSFASGIILLLVVLVIPEEIKIFRVILACVGNCFYFMSFIIVFLYGVELFPTSMRNSVLGVLSVMSRAGQIIAPVINEFSGKVAGCIFGGFAIAGGLLCIPLPETKNKELPSSLEGYQKKAGSPAAPDARQGVNIK